MVKLLRAFCANNELAKNIKGKKLGNIKGQ